jgi:preprotein translocase subunit SecB
MKNSPLLLERYYLSEVHFEANDALSATQPLPDLNLESTVDVRRHSDDERRYRVQLKVSFQPVSPDLVHQKGTVTFIGYFGVAPSYPLEKVLMLVETNGPSVLFGAAREMFCTITARGPWGMVTLPSQSFYHKPAPSVAENAPVALAAKPTTVS